MASASKTTTASCKRKAMEHTQSQPSPKKSKLRECETTAPASTQQEILPDIVETSTKSQVSKKRRHSVDDYDIKDLLPPSKKRHASTASSTPETDEVAACMPSSAPEGLERKQQSTPSPDTSESGDEAEAEAGTSDETLHLDDETVQYDDDTEAEAGTNDEILQVDDEIVQYDDDTETDPETETEVETDPEPEQPFEHVEGDQKTGISRFELSCHLSVTVQMIDCILEGRSLERFLGKVDKLDHFDFYSEDFGSRFSVLHLKTQVKEKEEDLVEWLRYARDSREQGRMVGVAARLSAFLSALRNGSDDILASYLFKQVFAYSSEDREEFDGASQQDCIETFAKVIEALMADPHLPDAVAFQELFHTNIANKISCSSHECEKEINSHESHRHWILDISRSKSPLPVNLSQLVDESLQSEMDDCCDCGADRTSETTFSHMPENLLLQVNRVNYVTGAKSMTPLDLTFDDITIGGTSYQLHAVIKHEGSSPNSGHYYILVKHSDDWLKLDDDLKTYVTPNELRDCRRNGQSAMLLLKKSTMADTQ